MLACRRPGAKAAQRVREQIAGGRASGVRSTPTFFVNGMLRDVSFGLQHLAEAVESALHA